MLFALIFSFGGHMLSKSISFFILFLLIALTACTNSAASTPSAQDTTPRVGALAPDFTLSTLDGSSIKLSDLRGSAVFINFWAVNCQYCRYEMPNIQKMHDDYAPTGLVVLGINVKDKASDAQTYIDRLYLDFPILLDADGKVTAAYLVAELPYSYFIDRDGVIQHIYIGEMKRTQMEEFVTLVLK